MLDSGLTEEAMVNQEFEELYPGKIQRTQMAYNSQVGLLKSAQHSWRHIHNHQQWSNACRSMALIKLLVDLSNGTVCSVGFTKVGVSVRPAHVIKAG